MWITFLLIDHFQKTLSVPQNLKIVDHSIWYKLLSFMDVYSGYNQIPMFISGRMNTSFMTEKSNYKYNVMPLKLKNTSVTYQRMMNKVFYEDIGGTEGVHRRHDRKVQSREIPCSIPLTDAQKGLKVQYETQFNEMHLQIKSRKVLGLLPHREGN